MKEKRYKGHSMYESTTSQYKNIYQGKSFQIYLLFLWRHLWCTLPEKNQWNPEMTEMLETFHTLLTLKNLPWCCLFSAWWEYSGMVKGNILEWRKTPHDIFCRFNADINDFLRMPWSIFYRWNSGPSLWLVRPWLRNSVVSVCQGLRVGWVGSFNDGVQEYLFLDGWSYIDLLVFSYIDWPVSLLLHGQATNCLNTTGTSCMITKAIKKWYVSDTRAHCYMWTPFSA